MMSYFFHQHCRIGFHRRTSKSVIKVRIGIDDGGDEYYHVCYIVAADWMVVTNERGYRTAKLSRGVGAGTWYFELEILTGTEIIKLPEDYNLDQGNGNHPTKPLSANDLLPHIRFGWATKDSGTQLPVGTDAYGYGLRDQPPTKFHNANGEKFGESFSMCRPCVMMMNCRVLHASLIDNFIY